MATEAVSYREDVVNPIVAASGHPDHRDSAHLRERWVDAIRPAIVRAGEGTDPRHYRAAH